MSDIQIESEKVRNKCCIDLANLKLKIKIKHKILVIVTREVDIPLTTDQSQTRLTPHCTVGWRDF